MEAIAELTRQTHQHPESDRLQVAHPRDVKRPYHQQADSRRDDQPADEPFPGLPG